MYSTSLLGLDTTLISRGQARGFFCMPDTKNHSDMAKAFHLDLLKKTGSISHLSDHLPHARWFTESPTTSSSNGLETVQASSRSRIFGSGRSSSSGSSGNKHSAAQESDRWQDLVTAVVWFGRVFDVTEGGQHHPLLVNTLCMCEDNTDRFDVFCTD
jgi:hypothetical protein